MFIQIYRIIGRDNAVYTVIGSVNPKMENKDVCGICFVSADNKNIYACTVYDNDNDSLCGKNTQIST